MLSANNAIIVQGAINEVMLNQLLGYEIVYPKYRTAGYYSALIFATVIMLGEKWQNRRP